MPAGMQIRNSSGQLVVDTSTRTARLIGKVLLDRNNGSVSFPAQTGQVFYHVYNPGQRITGSGVILPAGFHYPTISVSSSGISWTYANPGAGTNVQCTMLYGAF